MVSLVSLFNKETLATEATFGTLLALGAFSLFPKTVESTLYQVSSSFQKEKYEFDVLVRIGGGFAIRASKNIKSNFKGMIIYQ